LSTLTKILIVLLTVSSIFLCGIVVTYVANADNYREKYNQLKSDRDGLDRNVQSLKTQVNDKIKEKEDAEKRLNSEMASLKAKADEVQAKLDTAEREKSKLLEQVNSWTAITKDFYETNDKQGQLLKGTQEELKKAQSEQIELSRKLDETTTALVEKNAILGTLETEKKQLIEEKAAIQNKLDQLLQTGGRTVATVAAPVTQEKSSARPAQPVTSAAPLKGQITGIDLKNSWASISIGSADGVKEGMKFHATRGDQFICDVLIIDVDTDKAVGVLELVQQQPKTGDSVSTSL